MDAYEYNEQLKNKNGQCDCPGLHALFDHEDKARKLQIECGRLEKLDTALNGKGKRNWGIFWDHKATLRELNRAADEYYARLVMAIDDGWAEFVSHQQVIDDLWITEKLNSWDDMESAHKRRIGPVSINCASCGQQIDVAYNPNVSEDALPF